MLHRSEGDVRRVESLEVSVKHANGKVMKLRLLEEVFTVFRGF